MAYLIRMSQVTVGDYTAQGKSVRPGGVTTSEWVRTASRATRISSWISFANFFWFSRISSRISFVNFC